MTDIEKSKSDSMFGQAEGVRGNYKVSKDIYSQNAEYGEESKQQSTNSKIKTLGSIDNAVALDVTDASIKAQQMAGNTSGLMSVVKDKNAIIDFLSKARAEAYAGGRGEAFDQDLKNANLLSADGNSFLPENWISGKSFLQANNMNAHNALMAGGAVFSGALGNGTSTVKMDAMDSTKMGSELINNQDKLQKMEAFNMHQSAHGGKQIGFDEKTKKFNIPDKETAQQFAEFVGDTDLVNKTRSNALDETLAEIGNYLGVGSTGVVAGVGGTVVGLGAMALGNKVLPRSKSIPDKIESNSSNKDSNSKTNNINTEHDNTSEHRNNIKDYTEDYQKSQELRDREVENASNLKKQRNKLFEQGKDTSALDDKISDSYERAKGHQENMDKADRNIKAEKYIASKDIERERENTQKDSGGKLKAAGKASVGMLVTSMLDNAQEAFGIDPSQNRTLTAIQNVANMADGATESAFTLVSGLAKGAMQATTGNFSGAMSSVASGFTDAGVNLLNTYNNTLGNADARFAAQTQSAAPQHQGFTTMPIGHHTAQAISADMQQQAAQAQITTANNIQALTAITPNSVTPNRSYVGFTMQDAEQNPVSFTTDKASRNVMMNGSAYEF